MTAITVYECDGCGERWGHKTVLREYPVAHGAPNRFVEPLNETLLACMECEADFGLRQQKEIYHTQGVVGWGIDDGEVVGALYEDGTWKHDKKRGYHRDARFVPLEDLGEYETAVARFVEEVLL